MAATIQFPDGTKATLRGNAWHCPNADLRKLLTLTMDMLGPGYRPSPEADIAGEVAAELGAVVTHADPAPDFAPEDAEF